MFKLGDKVFDIMKQEWGVVKQVGETSENGISVSFEGDVYWTNYTGDGRRYGGFKTPSLTFKEFYLPDGWQERPIWRAEIGDVYWTVTGYGECVPLCDKRYKIDDAKFKLGNYFQTRKEAEESKFYKVFHEEV